MQLIYQSDSYIVVQFALPGATADPGAASLQRTGYEIVDKAGQREIYVEGLLAESFAEGVKLIAERPSPSVEDFDDFISGYAQLAQQPLALH
ncbi:MAG: DUF3567 domain-containing protein [Rubrivivax sp.]|jgi:hypothetical protein|nr:DUF3567 domain-containing protein [Rubrivivax sp.]